MLTRRVPVVTLCTTSFNVHKFYFLPILCICVDIGTKHGVFSYTVLIDWCYNGDGLFLLRGTECSVIKDNLSLCRFISGRGSEFFRQLIQTCLESSHCALQSVVGNFSRRKVEKASAGFLLPFSAEVKNVRTDKCTPWEDA